LFMGLPDPSRQVVATCLPLYMILSMNDPHFRERVEERIRGWKVVVQDTLETQSSYVAFGTREGVPVVLKVIRDFGDEWRCGEVLNAFDPKGVVRVYEYLDGAVLLEWLNPGTSLAPAVLKGGDEEATETIAEVIQRMAHQGGSLQRFVTVEAWGKGFTRYLISGDNQITADLVEKAEALYSHLCATQRGLRLLHGDLQHYNILYDRQRGWVAIDPKGVVGELEYEIGASLRNPYEAPELFTSRNIIESRLKRYESRLKLDSQRALGWGFAQAVLSAIWTIEDGYPVEERNPAVLLAKAIEPLVE
jgi:streptomycin 6-kinase